MRFFLSCLVLTFFSASTLLTIHCADAVFVRGRDASSILSIAFFLIACSWECAKFFLLHFGARHAPSAIRADSRAGIIAFLAALLMSVGSIAGVSYGAYDALKPTEQEKIGDNSWKIQTERREFERKKEAILSAQLTALMQEHAAMLQAKRLTIAHEVSKKITETTQKIEETQRNTREHAREHAGTQLEAHNIGIIGKKTAAGLCIALAVGLEIVIAALVVALGRLAAKAKKEAGNADVPGSGIAFPSVPEFDSAGTLEKIRTGEIRGTVRAVQDELKCGARKAMGIVAEAKRKGYITKA